VKALVTGLTKTLEIEKQKLKTQLQQIDAQKKMAASYDDTKTFKVVNVPDVISRGFYLYERI